MMRRGAPVLAAAIALLPDAASAHAPVPGVGAFWNGVLHPVLVPLHLLVLVTAGLVLGQNAPRASRTALPLFAVGLASAVVLASPAGLPASAGLAVVLVGSLLVALGRAIPIAVVAVAVAAAVVVGADSAPLDAAPGSGVLAAGGAYGGALLVVVLSGGLAAAVTQPWQRIAVRAAGSWIAAVTILMLAVSLSGRGDLT